ncbi:TIGR03086 family metal-binding protein [Arthrobacter castelli]|uniref:TIGR03086 family metal-binding protein n=1 Tax=Arthrobacter castelli TaxID=271431 RepID=UPI000413299E|nr:TIGR03086 family metal-binding protein [Arthrobacter castelli]
MLDLEPATNTMAELIRGVADHQLYVPTPCPDMSLGDLIDHVAGLSLAFTAAASKTSLEAGAGPSADMSRLNLGWRSYIPKRLAALAQAWRKDEAWEGFTQAGGVDLPGDVAGLVALDEVIVHGWDIAAASGQEFTCPPHLLEVAYGFLQASVAENPQGTPGLFDAPVAVADHAPLVDRVIGLTGRDPAWAGARR